MFRIGKKVVIAGIALIFMGTNLKAAADEHVESRRFSVLSIKGGEAYVIKGGSREIPAAAGMPLGQGNQARTGLKTSMFLTADQDKTIELASCSLAEITAATSKKLKLTLKSGELYFNVEKPLGSDESMSFETAQTSMSIRGTSGVIGCGDGGTTLLVFNGKVVLGQNEEGAGAGQMAFVTENGIQIGEIGLDKESLQSNTSFQLAWIGEKLDQKVLRPDLSQEERQTVLEMIQELIEQKRQEEEQAQEQLRRQQKAISKKGETITGGEPKVSGGHDNGSRSVTQSGGENTSSPTTGGGTTSTGTSSTTTTSYNHALIPTP